MPRVSTPWSVAVAATTGALGSVVSGAYNLRKRVRLRELRVFLASLVAQLAVGSAFGLFLFLLLHTGLVELPAAHADVSTYAYGVYGFIAGFSEPFALGLIAKLAGQADVQEAKPSSST
jgi:hypothetical protein